MNIKEVVVIIALSVIFLIISYIVRLLTCNKCPYKDECEKLIEKGEVPPCTKMSLKNPFNNQTPNGI